MKTPVTCCGEGCGKVLRWIEMPDDGVSHGLCPECHRIEMRKVDEYWRRQARAELAALASEPPAGE